ncbi:hypothetical protein GQR58_023997 [Nymphon striatum]|nr:hypothetical protein GQR58_023997 [Nymphon striatum]
MGDDLSTLCSVAKCFPIADYLCWENADSEFTQVNFSSSLHSADINALEETSFTHNADDKDVTACRNRKSPESSKRCHDPFSSNTSHYLCTLLPSRKAYRENPGLDLTMSRKKSLKNGSLNKKTLSLRHRPRVSGRIQYEVSEDEVDSQMENLLDEGDYWDQLLAIKEMAAPMSVRMVYKQRLQNSNATRRNESAAWKFITNKNRQKLSDFKDEFKEKFNLWHNPLKVIEVYISNYKRFLLTSLPNDTKSIHFCCDRYYANSLKSAERASRGETGGKVYEVSDQFRAPDPKAFFDVSENKAALLEYLCDNWVIGESVNPHQSIKLFLSGGFRDIHKSVLLTNGNESPVTELQSTHEEADTRLLLHSIYATQVEGVKRIVMYANDTDVIVLAVYYYKTKLKKLVLDEFWMKTQQDSYLPIHKIANTLDADFNATDLKRLPSTEDAFLLHLERSAYACIIDKTAHIANPVIPEPTEYGWISEGDNMIPHQMRNPSWPADAAKATNCSCKKGCQRNCSCSNASRRCNIGCLCRGHPDTCKRARLQEELEQELENESSDEESSGSSEGELED